MELFRRTSSAGLGMPSVTRSQPATLGRGPRRSEVTGCLTEAWEHRRARTTVAGGAGSGVFSPSGVAFERRAHAGLGFVIPSRTKTWVSGSSDNVGVERIRRVGWSMPLIADEFADRCGRVRRPAVPGHLRGLPSRLAEPESTRRDCGSRRPIRRCCFGSLRRTRTPEERSR